MIEITNLTPETLTVFLVSELVFNVVVLAGLFVLTRRRRPRRVAQLDRAKSPPRTNGNTAPSAPPIALDELVERAERDELVAERRLRSRLEQFRGRGDRARAAAAGARALG